MEKCREFFLGYRAADPERLKFEQCNLYDLSKETRSFDEIICYETLEHIRRDDLVVQQFYRILRPGGVLHICCPYRLHPRHQAEVLDEGETGGHVRAGYSEEEYRALLEPLGFRVERVVGVGPPSVYLADRLLRTLRSSWGDVLALPAFALLLPAVWFARLNRRVPFSIYVRAVKPGNLGHEAPNPTF